MRPKSALFLLALAAAAAAFFARPGAAQPTLPTPSTVSITKNNTTGNLVAGFNTGNQTIVVSSGGNLTAASGSTVTIANGATFALGNATHNTTLTDNGTTSNITVSGGNRNLTLTAAGTGNIVAASPMTGTSLSLSGDLIAGTSAGSLFLNPRSAPGNPGTAGASTIYVDSSDNQVKIKSSNGTVNVLGGATGNATVAGNLTVSGTGTSTIAGTLQFGSNGTSSVTRTTMNGVGAHSVFSVASDARTVNDAPILNIDARDSANNVETYVQLKAKITDATAGSEGADFFIATIAGGTRADRVTINSTGTTLAGNLTVSGTGTSSFAGDVSIASGKQLITNGSVSGVGVSLYGDTAIRAQTNGSGSLYIDTNKAGGTIYIRPGTVSQAATFSSTGVAILGTTTNDNAAPGYVGEYVSGTAYSGSAVALTSTTPANLAQISLTAGDWDVSGVAYFTQQAGTTSTYLVAGITQTSATLPANTTGARANELGFAGDAADRSVHPRTRITLSSTTTVYLVVQAAFSGGTCTASGQINARRVR